MHNDAVCFPRAVQATVLIRDLFDRGTTSSGNHDLEVQGSEIFCSPSMTKLQALNRVRTADLGKCQCVMLTELFQLKVMSRVGSRTCKHCSIRISGTVASKLSRDLGINEVDGYEVEPMQVDEGALFCNNLLLLCFVTRQCMCCSSTRKSSLGAVL